MRRRFLITLEQTETGFAAQVPDLAITTFGADIEAAKRAAVEAIGANLEAYRGARQPVPNELPVTRHPSNPAFRDHLFADVAVPESDAWMDVLKSCPVSPEDVPQRRRAPARHRNL